MELARRLFERLLDLLPGYRTHERLVDSYYRAMRTTGHEMRVDPVKNRDRNSVFAMGNRASESPKLRKAIDEAIAQAKRQGREAGGMGDGVAVEAATHRSNTHPTKPDADLDTPENPDAITRLQDAATHRSKPKLDMKPSKPDADTPETRTDLDFCERYIRASDFGERFTQALFKDITALSTQSPYGLAAMPITDTRIDRAITHSPGFDARWNTRDSCVKCRGEGCWACFVMSHPPRLYEQTNEIMRDMPFVEAKPEPDAFYRGTPVFLDSVIGDHEPLADHDVLARLAEFEAMMGETLAKRQKPVALFTTGGLDMNSPATLEKFKNISKAYTLEATKSKASALRALKSEGL